LDLTGYPQASIEKIGRLFDVLERIGSVKFLSNRLSFYGGSALNLIHFGEVPRLSVDLDFNYRHIDGEKDWGDVRKEIDHLLLRVLHDLGYDDDDIRIQARYPLGRIVASYRSSQERIDTIKVETGYMRRMPIMKEDRSYELRNPRSGSSFSVLSPCKEELFANKFCTMISRRKGSMNARDMFDVRTISRSTFDTDLFLDIVMVEGLLMDLDLTDPEILIGTVPSSNLKGLVIGNIDMVSMMDSVISFTKEVQQLLEERHWNDFRYGFKASGRMDRTYFRYDDKINDRLSEHPQLVWVNMKGRNKS
jgi:predicted nucleotidyltransferase component of viral defense system